MNQTPDAPGLGFLLHDVSRLSRLAFDRRAAPLGLTRSLWTVLAHLRHREGISQAALAQIMEIEPISLTRLIDRLAANGMVERRPDPADRRANQLYLTPAAQPVLKQMQDIAREVRVEALEGVTAEELQGFLAVAERLRANLSKARAQQATKTAKENDR